MVYPLDSSRMRSQMVFHTHNTKPWGYTQACGLLRIGQRGVGLWRLTGRKPHSLLRTKTSVQTLAFGLMEHLPVVPVVPLGVTVIHGYQNSWTTRPKARWNGCRTTTWFTITALIPRGSPKACPRNAACLKSTEKIDRTLHTQIVLSVFATAVYTI